MRPPPPNMTTLAQCSFAVWATYIVDPLCPPFVDADRKGGSSGGGLSARAWLVFAYLVICAIWAVARANDYWR
jgi:hypothetical protein